VIDLQSNFRSRAPLLEHQRRLARLMTETEAEIEYDDRTRFAPADVSAGGKIAGLSGAPIELMGWQPRPNRAAAGARYG